MYLLFDSDASGPAGSSHAAVSHYYLKVRTPCLCARFATRVIICRYGRLRFTLPARVRPLVLLTWFADVEVEESTIVLLFVLRVAGVPGFACEASA